jgi:nucleobase:cation symporter-1, NCS1 family
VCITAIFPSFYRMQNSFSASMPATTSDFVGFVVFWFISLPFLWLPPEKFRLPFQVSSVYCIIAMLSMSK